jgi:hypothetical protein
VRRQLQFRAKSKTVVADHHLTQATDFQRSSVTYMESLLGAGWQSIVVGQSKVGANIVAHAPVNLAVS